MAQVTVWSNVQRSLPRSHGERRDRATFNVLRPIPTQFSAQIVGMVAVDTNYHGARFLTDGSLQDLGVYDGAWLHFGINSSLTNVGIVFSFSNAPTFYGRYFLVQIINSGEDKRNLLNGTNLVGLDFPEFGLDSEYPYGKGNDLWHFGGYSQGRANDLWIDGPGVSLASHDTWISQTESFTMYLMFQYGFPDFTYSNSIPVPMYSATWSWSGIVKTNSSPLGFYLYSNSVPTPSVTQTVSYPTWSTNVLELQPQMNLPAFNEN